MPGWAFGLNFSMNPMQDPGLQHNINFLEHAPIIGVAIAIPILIIVIFFGKKGRF